MFLRKASILFNSVLYSGIPFNHLQQDSIPFNSMSSHTIEINAIHHWHSILNNTVPFHLVFKERTPLNRLDRFSSISLIGCPIKSIPLDITQSNSTSSHKLIENYVIQLLCILYNTVQFHLFGLCSKKGFHSIQSNSILSNGYNGIPFNPTSFYSKEFHSIPSGFGFTIDSFQSD